MQQQISLNRHYDTNFEWSPRLIEKAQNAIIGPQGRPLPMLIVWGVVVLSLVYLSFSLSRFVFGEAMFVAGMLFTMVLILVTQKRNLRNAVAQVPHTEVTVRMDEEYFESQTLDSHGRFYWRAFREVRITPEVTLLFPRRGIGAYIPIPTQAMSQEMQAFLIEKVEGNGGKVVRFK
jgi:hypothetical protein